MNTPSVASISTMPSTMACTSSIWAKQLAAVTTLGGAVLALDLARHVDPEIALDGRDAALVGDLADVGRLDAEDAMPAVLEVRDQRAVIGADIDNEIVLRPGRASSSDSA